MKRLAWIAARHHRPRAPIETVFAGVDPGADRAALALFSTLPCDVDLRFLHTSGSDEEPSAILPRNAALTPRWLRSDDRRFGPIGHPGRNIRHETRR
jgi:hypothetical protein